MWRFWVGLVLLALATAGAQQAAEAVAPSAPTEAP